MRLTEERWFHIVKHHPELKKHHVLILKAVTRPSHILVYARTKDLAAVAEFAELVKLGLAPNLVVHYKETSDRDGFMVTAFPISEGRMWRKFRRWQRLR
jgi:hypothetical protein